MWGRLLFFSNVMLLGTSSILAQESLVNSQLTEHTMRNSYSLTIPTEYQNRASVSGAMDKEAITLTRYTRGERTDNALYGEHFSTVYDQKQRLKGMAFMDRQFIGKAEVSKDEARATARAFLERYAPDLLENAKEAWVDDHDESIMVGGQKQTLTGMKVKMRNLTDNLWYWVIVGKGNQVMVFERDIYWITLPGKRRTEQWLHDSWLDQQKIALTAINH